MKGVSASVADLNALSDAEWLARIEKIGEEAGYFEPLGANHAAFFVDDSPTLLVTFETLRQIRERQPGQLPMGYDVARSRAWSHLCLIAASDTWYRDPNVYGYFDRLVDDAFFEDFDQVVFYGAGMGGYAAAAYSVTAPGATVIAIQPQATLDPHLAGWDPRFMEKRRLSFTDRYGYAPEMTDGAGKVFVIYDPEQKLDAVHAALFARPQTTLIGCRHLGRDIGGALDELRILPSMLAAAASGTFDSRLFSILYRSRRSYKPYLSRLLARLDRDARPKLAAMLCRNVVNRLGHDGFDERLEELEEELRGADD